MLPVLSDRDEFHPLSFSDIDIHIREAVAEGDSAEVLRVFPVVLQKGHSAVKPVSYFQCALLKIIVLVPARAVHGGGGLQRGDQAVGFLQPPLHSRVEHFEGKVIQGFRKLRMTLQLCEPPFPVVPQPHADPHHIGQAPQSGRAHREIKVPGRTAVEKRIIHVFKDEKAEALHIPLGREILEHVHPDPGIQIQIFLPGFACIRIDPVLLIESLLRFSHIVCYIFLFPERNRLRILDDKMMPVSRKPVFFFLIAGIHLQQIAPADVVRNRLLGGGMDFQARVIHQIDDVKQLSGLCRSAVGLSARTGILVLFLFRRRRGRHIVLPGYFPGSDGRIVIVRLKVADFDASALGVGALGQKIKAVIEAVEIDIDVYRLRCCRHLTGGGYVQDSPVFQEGGIGVIGDQGKLFRFFNSQNTSGRGEVQAVLLFIRFPAAVSPSVDPAPPRGVFGARLRIKNIAALFFHSLVMIDGVHASRGSLKIESRDLPGVMQLYFRFFDSPVVPAYGCRMEQSAVREFAPPDPVTVHEGTDNRVRGIVFSNAARVFPAGFSAGVLLVPGVFLPFLICFQDLQLQFLEVLKAEAGSVCQVRGNIHFPSLAVFDGMQKNLLPAAVRQGSVIRGIFVTFFPGETFSAGSLTADTNSFKKGVLFAEETCRPFPVFEKSVSRQQ